MTSKNYNKIVPQVEARLREVELGQARAEKDIKYIRESLDNHLNTQGKIISSIDKKIDDLSPKVEACHSWISKVQKYVVWPAVGTGVLALITGVGYLIWEHIPWIRSLLCH